MGLPAMSAEVYVSPAGDDANDGSQASPVATLEKARDLARAAVGQEAVTVTVADGIYYLPSTLKFLPEDSGTAEHPVLYRAENEGEAILSGGSLLSLEWQPYEGGVYLAKTPEGLEIDQLFVNGRNQRMARYPDYAPNRPTAAYQGYASDAVSKERAARWKDPAGGYIHAMHEARWGGYQYVITGKEDDGELAFEGGWQNNRPGKMHKEFRMVENIFEELDAPGEWYHNAETNTLCHIPAVGVDLKDAKIEVVRLRHLVEFNGSEAEPVKHITIRGFVVRHAARTFMDTKEPLLRSDWTIYRGGAFMLTGTEHVSVLDCEFDQVGGNAIFVSNYNRHVLIKGCHIHDTGASGICFVGDPDAVRDPLFRYGQTNDLEKIDRAVGPKTENYPADSAVEDCLIHGIGRVERQPAGIQVSMSARITIRDTSIYDTARAGINFSEGTWGGHLIERCDVFDTVLETHDHGSFNSWGRDRFWHRNRGESQRVIDKEPDLPFLDAMDTTVIRDSRWRCDHGWDIDLDDGSSNYDIYNNLMLNGGLKFREGFKRRAWNNIMVNNGFHPNVWYNNSNDEFFSNIVMRSARGARTPTETAFGKRIDGNLFYTENPADKDQFANVGWDLNSINGDPLFVSPESGDYTVAEGSPAFSIGFENFDMDQFGVKKPSLKAIARTPILPELRFGDAPRRAAAVEKHVQYWLGAQLHTIANQEFSAYGTLKEDGGVAITSVPKDSPAEKAGLQVTDLIQAVNGKPTRTVEDFVAAVTAVGAETLNLKLIRLQKEVPLQVQPVTHVLIEQANDAKGFSKKLSLPRRSPGTVTTQPQTSNDPISVLTDGKLAKTYGPVFRNGVGNGVYKMDLGAVKSVNAITSWSHAQGPRSQQRIMLYGSNAAQDPGWDLRKYVPLGSLDTGEPSGHSFTAASFRSVDGTSLGEFRWIVWAVSPVNSKSGSENTAFQKLAVEVID